MKKRKQETSFLVHANNIYSNYGYNIMIYTMIVLIITGLCFIIPFWGFILSFLVFSCLNLGFKNNTISIFNGEVKSYENLFSHFKTMLSSVLLKLVCSIMVVVWTLCFIIPGVVMGLNLFFADYIYAEEKLSINECIEKSKKLVYGNRLALLVVVLSCVFITCVAVGASVALSVALDYFLSIAMWVKIAVPIVLSLIILAIFIIPYYQTIFASLYVSLSKKNIEEPKQKNVKYASTKA